MNRAYTLSNIEFAYDKQPALQIGHFAVEQNSVHALLGANGSGKTTLLNLLAFVTQPTKGQVLFLGEPVNTANLAEIRRQTGYVQQKPYLFHFSVRQNIELGLKLRGLDSSARRNKAEKAAERLGVQDLLSKRANELSGGEIQKVAIARALVLEPKVLLLDEPFTYLDRESRRDFEDFIIAIRNEAMQTVIFSTHDQLQAWNLANRVNHMVDGHAGDTTYINTFRGSLNPDRRIFDTGKQEIHVPESFSEGAHVAIEANQVVVSMDKLQSSMRNQFRGKVLSMEKLELGVQLVIEAGETWHANVTHSAVQELGIQTGADIWLSFKSTALQIF